MTLLDRKEAELGEKLRRLVTMAREGKLNTPEGDMLALECDLLGRNLTLALRQWGREEPEA